MAHWGAQELFPRYAKGFKVFPRKKVRVLVGDPVDLSQFAGSTGDKATLEAMTEVIMKDVTTLLETLRGEQAPAERWDPAAHHQASHGRFVERGAQAPAAQTPPAQAPAAQTSGAKNSGAKNSGAKNSGAKANNKTDDAGTPETGDAQ